MSLQQGQKKCSKSRHVQMMLTDGGLMLCLHMDADCVTME